MCLKFHFILFCVTAGILVTSRNNLDLSDPEEGSAFSITQTKTAAMFFFFMLQHGLFITGEQIGNITIFFIK